MHPPEPRASRPAAAVRFDTQMSDRRAAWFRALDPSLTDTKTETTLFTVLVDLIEPYY